MAIILKLKEEDGTQLVDLAPNQRQGDTRITPSDDGKVTETHVLTKRDTRANIRTYINTIRDAITQADDWHKHRHRHNSVWLHHATEGETEKRALVYNAVLNHLNAPNSNRELTSETVKRMLAITRHEAFENLTNSSFSDPATISLMGGKADAYQLGVGLFGGTADSRIYLMRLLRGNLGTATDIKRLWIGIRPVNEGLTSFDPVLDCRYYGNNSADTDTFADSNSISGTTARVRFSEGGGSDSLGGRFSMRIGDYEATNPNHYIGDYLAILRYKITTTATLGIQLATTWQQQLTPDSANLNELQYVSYADANYHFLPLGTITIPPTPYRAENVDMLNKISDVNLLLRAEQISGTGALYADAIILMPSNHMISYDFMAWTEAQWHHTLTHADDEISPYTVNAASPTSIYHTTPFAPQNWTYPKEGGALVFAGERADNAHKNDYIDDLDFYVYKRWLEYNG